MVAIVGEFVRIEAVTNGINLFGMTPMKTAIALLTCASMLLMTTTIRAYHGHKQTGVYLVYVGTYTGGDSEGIYAFTFDSNTGELKPHGEVTKTVNPSFVDVHPNGKYLYAVNETVEYKGEKAGYITSFSIDQESGALTELNQQSTKGGAPCHLCIDYTGRTVMVANYVGGSVAAYRVQSDGSLSAPSSFVQHTGKSVHPRQEAPHGHSIDVGPWNRFVAVSDLGLDKVLVYRLNPRKGTLTPGKYPFAKSEAGSGPRHFSFHRSGRFAYGINELNMTANAYKYNGRLGKLEPFKVVSTLPPNESQQDGHSTAEMYCHPSGKFVYGSNRGHDTIVVYSVDQRTGKLTYVENQDIGGETPRSFRIDPTGKYLLALGQSSSSISVFEIDQDTGALEPTGATVKCPTPVSAVFMPWR